MTPSEGQYKLLPVHEPEEFASSPAAHRLGARRDEDCDDTLSDPDQQEIQHDSLMNRVADTQFGILEPETQSNDDEPSLTKGAANFRSQAPSAVLPELPPFLSFGVGIERPNGIDVDDDTSGFKFMKAPQPPESGQYSRYPGNPAEVNPKTNSKTDIQGLAQPLSAGVASRRKLPYPPVNPAHKKEVVHSREGIQTLEIKLNPEPAGASRHSLDHLSCKESMLHETTPPSGLKSKQALLLSEHQRPSADSTKESRLVNDIHMPPSPAKLTKRKHQDVQNVPRNFGVQDDPAVPRTSPSLNRLATDAPAHHQSSTSGTFMPSPTSKSHKVTNPPFLDVLPPNTRDHRSRTILGPPQHRATKANRTLRPVDVNKVVADAVSADRYSESHISGPCFDRKKVPVSTTADNTSRRETLTTHSHNNSIGQPETRMLQEIAAVGHFELQSDAVLSPPANPRDIENRTYEAHVDVLQEQSLASPTRDGAKDIFSLENDPDSHAEPGTCLNAVEGGYHQLHTPSQPQSRPQSAMSNTSKMRSRPLTAEDLRPEGVSEPAILSAKHSTKVQKSLTGPAPITWAIKSPQMLIIDQHTPLTDVHGIRDFTQHLSGIQQALQDFEDQKAILETRQKDIDRLNISNAESSKEIQRLEKDNVALSAKIKKLVELSARYKAHMNDVVQAQKHLMQEHKNIQTESFQIRKESKAALQALAEREKHEMRLRSLLSCAKEKLHSVEKMQELEEENAKCKSDIEKLGKSNELLQSDLDARLLDLGRERHNTELLQKNLNAQTEAHLQLIETLKEAQANIVDELTKKGSVLANTVNSQNSIQTKIDELSEFLNTLNSRELELPAALIKFIEDIHTRIETRLQASENQDIILSESSLKVLRDVKEHINQLRFDEELKASLNEKISDLRESNAALVGYQSARELDCESMAKEIDEMRRDLSNCRGQLTTNSHELAALRALPKGDPISLARVQELEIINSRLEDQINTIKQEASKAKEEVVSSRESARSAQEESQLFQHKFSEAQAMLRSLLEDKKTQSATRQADIDKACQEIAKAADAAKTEAKMHHDSMVKNLEQRRSAAENESALAHEELRETQGERASYISNFNKVQEELSMYKKQMAQQSAYIQRCDKGIPGRDEFECRESRLKQICDSMTQMRAHFDAEQKVTAHKIGEAVVSHQNETVHLIKRVKDFEKENALLKEERFEIQTTYESFKASVERGLRQSGTLAANASVDAWVSNPVHTPFQMGPPAAPIPKYFGSQRPLPTSSDLPTSQVEMTGGDCFTDDMPEDVLRQNKVRVKPVLQRKTRLQGNSSALDLQAAGIPYTKAVVAPNSVQLIRVASTTVGINSAQLNGSPAESLSPYQGNLKRLRPANRKSSGISQPVQMQEVSTTTTKTCSVKVSNLGALPRNLDVGFMAPAAQHNMAPSSARLSHRLSSGCISKSVIQPPRTEENANLTTDVAITKDRSTMTPTRTGATPISDTALLESSSPLSDLDPLYASIVDKLVGSDEEAIQEAHLPTKAGAVEKEVVGTHTSAASSTTANPVVGVKFKNYTTDHHFSVDVVASKASDNRSAGTGLPAASESVRRRQSLPLKSALKKKKVAGTSIIQDGEDTVQIPMSTPTMPKTIPPVNKNKQQALARKDSINSMIRGSKSGNSSQPSTAQKPSTKPTVTNGDKSPLMQAPPRNRKRLASGLLDTTKPFKQPRLTLRVPGQGQRETRTVIPDSQEDR